MTNPFQQFNREARFLERRGRNVSVAIQPPSLANAFGDGQTFTRNFQIIIAIAKFNEQFGQGNQMFHLEAQRAAAAAAHGFQFRALFLDMRILNWSVFSPLRSVPDANFELMGKDD